MEVHVDDFYCVGPGNAPERLLKKVGEKLTLLIEGPFNLDNPEFVHPKRRRTITPEGLWIAPSENHLKKLLELCGLDYKSKTRDTPLTKEVISAEPTEELDMPANTAVFGQSSGS